ncbi:MAG TPA: hypothetical protein VE035_11135 [Puia sp.]|nr:hypothetical protein [Puia sp.]
MKYMRMTPSGGKKTYRRELYIIIGAFLISRILVAFFGTHFRYEALFTYWQYLDTGTLRYHLLQGLWYDHAQPPFFNLLLGLVLKISGDHAPMAFTVLLMVVSLVNCLLLFILLKRTVPHRYIPLAVTLLYTLSPALMIFESELFYTTFVSMLLLTSAVFLLRLEESAADRQPAGQWKYVAGICLSLILVCLTRSMYHLLWLAALSAILLFRVRKSHAFPKLATGLSLSLLLVTGWYVKNYIIFGQFSTSSWIGMNLARTVFHGANKDSSRIEAIEPFSDMQSYRPFIEGNADKKYAGLDDRDLLREKKNDSLRNLNYIGYIEVSQKYMTASKAYMKSHPLNYLKNVLQSSIIFFAPATRYPFSEIEAPKIKYYDLAYSFNLTHFANGLQQRRIALTLSAIPKIMVYLAVFYILLKEAVRQKRLSLSSWFIFFTICFVFLTSSLMEHYENMRFRYEIEPLFLVLLGQALYRLVNPILRPVKDNI